MRTELQHISEICERGDLETAHQLALAALQSAPEDGRLWELLGLIQYARRQYESAVGAFERASLLVPLTPTARVCLGHAYGQSGRSGLSAELLEAAIRDPHMTIPLLLQAAAGLDAVDRTDLALAACRKAVARDPQAAQPYYDLGYYSARCGLPSRLTESLARRAIRLAPERVCYRVGLASLLWKQDRLSEAYAVVSQLSDCQLEQIRCRGCLERIVDLYESAHDYRRAVLGRLQLLRLELQSETSDYL